MIPQGEIVYFFHKIGKYNKEIGENSGNYQQNRGKIGTFT